MRIEGLKLRVHALGFRASGLVVQGLKSFGVQCLCQDPKAQPAASLVNLNLKLIWARGV